MKLFNLSILVTIVTSVHGDGNVFRVSDLVAVFLSIRFMPDVSNINSIFSGYA